MKQLNTKKQILILMLCFVLTDLCGCARNAEVEFVEAEELETLTSEAESEQAIDRETEQMQNTESVQTAGQAENLTDKSYENSEDSVLQAKEEARTEEIVVHVCGAVRSPGVYSLSGDSRVIDAVNRAGGLQETADSEFINLASRVSDGDRIWIPTKDESAELLRSGSDIPYITSSDETIGGMQEQQSTGSDKININTADEALLCTIPGIGQTRAAAIIAYREEYGAFSSIEDIMNVSGIKDGSFQKIKDYIIVN